jgi:hypothetical protein
MQRALPFPALTRERPRKLQDGAVRKRDFQRVQCLVFRLFGYPSDDGGVLVGLSAVTVRRVRRDWREKGGARLFGDRRGGRYNEHMTAEGERTFLAPFFEKASTGGVTISSSSSSTARRRTVLGRRS